VQLRYHFGKMRLDSITRGEIERFKVWLSQLPTRSVIEEPDGGHQQPQSIAQGRKRRVSDNSSLARGGLRAIELIRTRPCLDYRAMGVNTYLSQVFIR